MVIILLNHERIRVEVVELTRMRIAQLLRVSLEDVEVAFERDEQGALATGWNIKSLPEGVDPQKAKQSVVALAKFMRDRYLKERLDDASRPAWLARGMEQRLPTLADVAGP